MIDFPSSLHKQLETAYVWKSAKWHTSEEGIFNPNLQKAFAQHGFKREKNDASNFAVYQLLLHTAMFCLCCLEIVSKPGQVKSIFFKKNLKWHHKCLLVMCCLKIVSKHGQVKSLFLKKT